MIKDLFFIVKMLGLTVIVSLVMQARVGEKTIEEEFHHWLKASLFVDYVQGAIDGGMAITKAGYKKADTGIHSLLAKVTKRREGKNERGLSFELKRHNKDDRDGEDLNLPVAKAPGSRTR